MMNWAIYLQVSLDKAGGNNSVMQRAKVSDFSSNSHLVVTKHLSAERDIRYRVRVVRRHHKYDSLNSESEMEDEDEDEGGQGAGGQKDVEPDKTREYFALIWRNGKGFLMFIFNSRINSTSTEYRGRCRCGKSCSRQRQRQRCQRRG